MVQAGLSLIVFSKHVLDNGNSLGLLKLDQIDTFD